jgi:hypothetical protein
MGIEPTLSGWEPEVLPLNYARPDGNPIDGRIIPREGNNTSPLGWSHCDLSSDKPPAGSLHAFASGRSFHPLYGRLQAAIRLLRHPLPLEDSAALAGRLVRLSSGR